MDVFAWSASECLASTPISCAITSPWTQRSDMDAFLGYNQICMHPRDECKTAFMTELSYYCYKVMPFGLKNAGATHH